MKFLLQHSDSETKARAGILFLPHGEVETPAFMPVGTQGTVKSLDQLEIQEIGTRVLLGNTYHLALRPGTEVLRDAGGLHRFMGWPGPILTDSGGYQVFSLAQLRKIDLDGVTFQSHIDGSYHHFTPERVLDIQRIIGSDIMMILDECAPAACGFEYAKASTDLTLRWASRAREYADRLDPLYGYSQAVFGIVQGNVYHDLRIACASALAQIGFDGYAIGGLSVGEPADIMYRVTDLCTDALPPGSPRYLMGVGTPVNIIECIERGVDMFDCVLPTRNGRNGMVYTSEGPLTMRKERYSRDFGPVDSECDCVTCTRHTRAYLCHLFRAKEILALRLASLHNLAFYQRMMRGAREAILADRYRSWKESFLHKYENTEAAEERETATMAPLRDVSA